MSERMLGLIEGGLLVIGILILIVLGTVLGLIIVELWKVILA